MRLRLIIGLLISFFLNSLFASTIYFPGPKGWDCLKKQTVESTNPLVVYVGPPGSLLTPSLLLSQEKCEVSFEQYIEEVKQYHLSKGGKCVEEKVIETTIGKISLLQLTGESKWGLMTVLQGIMIYENHAYVMTGSCLTEDFPKYKKALENCMVQFNLLHEAVCD